MPKLKTNKGMSKRVKVTGGGKLLRRKAFRNHLFGHKSAATKRSFAKEFEVAPGDLKLFGETAFGGGRFMAEEMIAEGLAAQQLTAAGNLDAFGHTFIGFELWHLF